MRAISGRVTWENGDPADHVIAHALLVRRNRAEFRAGDALLSPANEHGDFRIGNLKLGRYVVYSYTMGMASDSASDPIALPVFYPGSPSPEIGAAVDLRSTDEVSHISMILRESEGVSVEGTFVASAALPQGSPAQVALMIPGNPAQPFAAARTKVGQPFKLSGIPRGIYDMITVSSTSPNVRSVQTLRVDGPIQGLKVSAGELQPVAGTIRYDEPVAPPSVNSPASSSPPVSRSLDGVTVWLACPDLQLFGIAATRTDKEGKFNVGTFPGLNYLLTITPPQDSWVAHVYQQGKELDGYPFPVMGGSGGIEVVLKRDASSITGTVTGPDSGPVRAFVVAAPKNRRQEHLFRTAMSGADGAFNLTNVAPGEYDVFALDRNEEDAYLDPGYLDRFANHASAAKVGANTAISIGLSMIKIPLR